MAFALGYNVHAIATQIVKMRTNCVNIWCNGDEMRKRYLIKKSPQKLI
jgi:hypothetical protein